MPRTQKADRAEAKLKTWLKRHEPEYQAKLRAKNKEKETKLKRNAMSRHRRAGHSATHQIFKKFSPLTDKHGNMYIWLEKYKKLTRNDCEVVRRARDGTLHYLPYEREEDLDDEKYDEPIVSDLEKKVVENVERLLSGSDLELEEKMKKRKFMVTRELSDEDCYWKKLTDVQKRKLLKKLKRNIKNGEV